MSRLEGTFYMCERFFSRKCFVDCELTIARKSEYSFAQAIKSKCGSISKCIKVSCRVVGEYKPTMIATEYNPMPHEQCERNARIINAYNKGDTQTAIAEREGMTRQRVKAILESNVRKRKTATDIEGGGLFPGLLVCPECKETEKKKTAATITGMLLR